MKRIAILTGGGDCPGLNAAIRAVTRVAHHHFGIDVIGIRNGFEGLITDDWGLLTLDDVRGVLRVGGTFLGSSNRTNPFRYTGPELDQPPVDASGQAFENFQRMEADALIVVGGDGTLFLANEFGRRYNVPIIGIPKTIDNDVHGSDYTIGFDSAMTTVTNAVDNIHTTAESHHRVIIIEAMGRTAGWIALYAGVSGGADVVLIPERTYTLEGIATTIENRRRLGHHFTVIVVAEGISGPGGSVVYRNRTGEEHNWKLGGVCVQLSAALQDYTALEIRSIVLGHLQRGGAPTPFDRAIATQLGAAAVQSVVDGHTGIVLGIQSMDVVATPIEEVARGPRLVPDDHPMIRAAMRMGMYLG